MRKIKWRHSEKNIKVKDSAGLCVCACVSETQKKADESLTSGFIRVRNELPSRIFLLTHLEKRWMDGQTDGWMDKWRETEKREIGRTSTEVQSRGSFLHCPSRWRLSG